MKKYVKIFSLLIAFSVVLSSCDKNDELIVFDVDNGQTLTQFDKTSGTMPTPSEGVTTYEATVLVTTVSSSDREISIMVDDSVENAASSDQFTLSRIIIPANSYLGTLTVTSNYDALPEEGSRFLVIKINGVQNTTDMAFEKEVLTLELFRKCPVVAGTYTIYMQDSYGDGWQGQKITVTIDGASSDYFLLNWWDGGYSYGPQFYDWSETFEVPAGTEELKFEFTSGQYNDETSFQIESPNGIQFASGADAPDGPLGFNTCNT